jgi:ATP-dependent DNA ligase
VCATFDGELVAFGADGTPDFPLVCKRMRMRRRSIAVTYVMFDLLTLEGDSLLNERYSKRRAELEELRFERALERVSRRNPRVATRRASAAGSRQRIANTGDTSWSARAQRRVHADPFGVVLQLRKQACAK